MPNNKGPDKGTEVAGPTPATREGNVQQGFFHGIVKRAGRWLRLVSGLPLLSNDVVVKEYEGGPYMPAFLMHFFAGQFRVEVRKINRKALRGVKPVIKSDGPTVEPTPVKSEVLRFSTASEQYVVRIKGNNGWLARFKEIGLLIGNSKKMSKRLVELVRLSCMWLYRDAENALTVEVIDHEALGFPDCYVDGATAISKGLAIKCVKSNTLASRTWRARHIWAIRSGKTAVVQIRMMCELGLIKGNAVIVSKSKMNGYDVRTFWPNIKAEVRTTGWQWLTIEPTYGAIPVKSDDQTHAIYRRVNGLYDSTTLLQTLKFSLEQFFQDLKEGKRSEWMEKLADNADELLHEDEEDKHAPNRGMVQIIQETVAKLNKLGIPLLACQTLMFMSVRGLSLSVLGSEEQFRERFDREHQGQVWRDKDRHWFPVPWAYAAHVYTKEVLEIFGHKMPKGNQAFYHEATHSFVVPGWFFEKNLKNHGGPDLDDTVKVHIRQVRHKNGRIRTMAIIMRNPNDFGEWSMISIGKDVGPVFHAYTEEPPLVDLEELTKLVPQFTKLEKSLNIGTLPAVKNPPKLGPEFSIADETRIRHAAMGFPPGVGGTVIPKMIWNALLDQPIMDLVDLNENIIDVLQQGQGSTADTEAIKQWVEDVFYDLGVQLGFELDSFWFFTRMPDALIEQQGWKPADESLSPWVTLHREREFMTRKYISEMTDWLNEHIVMPDVLANMNFTSQEYTEGAQKLSKMRSDYLRIKADYGVDGWVQWLNSKLASADEKKGEEYTDRLILLLAQRSIVAKKANPKRNHDQWLYQFSVKSTQQPVDWFVRALKRVQDGTYNWSQTDQP